MNNVKLFLGVIPRKIGDIREEYAIDDQATSYTPPLSCAREQGMPNLSTCQIPNEHSPTSHFIPNHRPRSWEGANIWVASVTPCAVTKIATSAAETLSNSAFSPPPNL